MKNLAGEPEADTHIRAELTRALIPMVKGESGAGEVPYTVTGKMGEFRFHRAWYYWVVEGPIPLAIAEELYEDPMGKTDVRSGGDCACRPPKTWTQYFDADGKKRIPDKEEAAFQRYVADGTFRREVLEELHFVPEPSEGAARAIVNLYHIDTEVGLRLFADTLRKHGLDQ